jgi:hypothetical protein
MASDYVPSHFLSFPNEIIRSVFDYLSPTDLLVSFGYLPNERVQSLIAVHMSSLKLTITDSSSLNWLNQHLSVVQQHVKHISIDVLLVLKLLKMIPVLDALTIFYDEDSQHLIDHFVTHFQKIKSVHVGALTLSTFDGLIRSETAELLLGGNGQLPEHTLIIDSCLLQININRLPLSQLRHVSFIVKEEKILHVLCAHLPNLETIQIAFISSGLKMDMSFLENLSIIGISSEIDDKIDTKECIRHPKYEAEDKADDISVVAPVHLRSIVIQGHIAIFNRLSRLFELSSTSLKAINMNIFAYSIIDPEQINNVAPHIDFRFNINYNMIEMPSNFDWQKYVDGFTQRPVLRCENTKFCDLSSVINRSVFWLRTTKMFVTSPQSLCFSYVHTLKFQYCKISMTTEAVKFIRQSFPQMHTLIWRLSPPNVSTRIPLDMVKTLIVHSDDRKTLGSLLLLCPDVSEVCFTRAFKRSENLPELKDAHIQNTCKQITLVKLIPEDEMTKQQINELFPNANVIYDATSYHEKMF